MIKSQNASEVLELRVPQPITPVIIVSQNKRQSVIQCIYVGAFTRTYTCVIYIYVGALTRKYIHVSVKFNSLLHFYLRMAQLY